MQFNTVEEALEELRNGKIILVTDDPIGRTKGISSARQNLQPQKTSTSWHAMARA